MVLSVPLTFILFRPPRNGSFHKHVTTLSSSLPLPTNSVLLRAVLRIFSKKLTTLLRYLTSSDQLRTPFSTSFLKTQLRFQDSSPFQSTDSRLTFLFYSLSERCNYAFKTIYLFQVNTIRLLPDLMISLPSHKRTWQKNSRGPAATLRFMDPSLAV